MLALLLGVTVLMMSALVFAQAPPAKVTLPAAMGGVTFDHAAHAKVGKCADCHHAAKAGKAMKSAHEACTDCHTKAGTPGNATKLPVPFHNASAATGLCIDCHKAKAGAGVPTSKCADCHKK